MQKKDSLIISILLLIILGCNDKYICHNCSSYNLNLVGVDWSKTEKPDSNCSEIIVITGTDGQKITIGEDGGVDEFDIELEDGEYHVFLGDDVDNIDYDDNSVEVETDEDGFVHEPEPFSAGETTVVIKNNRITSTGKVVMVRETRELIVKIRIVSGMKHFSGITGFNCLFDGVTVSRDISQGFPPYKELDRPLKETVHGKLQMAFTREDLLNEKGEPSAYLARHRLLGIDSKCEKIMNFYYREDNLSETTETVFHTLDVTNIIDDFHTHEDVSEPYVLILDLAEDAVTGNIVIMDWMIGDINDLIATEK